MEALSCWNVSPVKWWFVHEITEFQALLHGCNLQSAFSNCVICEEGGMLWWCTWRCLPFRVKRSQPRFGSYRVHGSTFILKCVSNKMTIYPWNNCVPSVITPITLKTVSFFSLSELFKVLIAMCIYSFKDILTKVLRKCCKILFMICWLN